MGNNYARVARRVTGWAMIAAIWGVYWGAYLHEAGMTFLALLLIAALGGVVWIFAALALIWS